MGRYGTETVRVGDDVQRVIDQYAKNRLIDCRGRHLAASDLGIDSKTLDELLAYHGVEKAQMKRGKS